MKKLIILAFIICSNWINAQTQAAFKSPIDEASNLITYAEVMDFKGLPADTLYRRLNSWFKKFYKNPTEVIKSNEADKRTIIGQHKFKIYKPDPAAKKGETKTVEAGLIDYTISVVCRENRARYEITRFNWKQNSYYPAERWLDAKTPNYDVVIFNGYLKQIEDYVKLLGKDLEETLDKAPVVKKDEW